MPDFSNWTCPLPLRDYPSIVMGHGGGGKLSQELIEHLFLPLFRNDALAVMGDASVVPSAEAGARLAISTDSFVVRPLFFPGGSIGELAVNGTVNDLAMRGARPAYLSAGFILEEGFQLRDLARIVASMAEAARSAGVQIITGDTKVVERGHGDGCYINTTGVGFVPEDVHIGPAQARAGDVILLSGTIGDHGMAIMSVREGLEFATTIESDCTALHDLVRVMLECAGGSGIHTMRDPTRGGLAATLQEIARGAGVGALIDERSLPVRPEVQAACEILGMDSMFVANEGKLVAFVDPEAADAVLDAMKQHPLGRQAARIGTLTSAHRAGMVVARTAIGGNRVIPEQVGEQLPRIC